MIIFLKLKIYYKKWPCKNEFEFKNKRKRNTGRKTWKELDRKEEEEEERGDSNGWKFKMTHVRESS